MKRFHPIPLLLAATLCIGIAACTDPLSENNLPTDNTHGATVPVTLGFSVLALTPAGDTPPAQTRLIGSDVEDKTGDNTDNYIKNVWVLQFDGTGTTATLKKSVFVDTDKITVNTNTTTGVVTGVLTDVELLDNTQSSAIGATQQLLLIANVSDGASHTWAATNTTLGNFLTAASALQSIASEADTYTTLDQKPTLFLSGILDNGGAGTAFYTDPTTVIPLKRSIAKLTLNLKIASGYSVTGLRLHNVPNQLAMASAVILSQEGAPTIYPAVTFNSSGVVSNYIDYAAENIPTQVGDGTSTVGYTWYLPANLKGTNPSATTAKSKSLAPPTATYIEVSVTDGVGNLTVYHLYPGADMTSDYNLRSNYHYTLNLTVNGTDVGADDTRGVEYRKDEIIDCTAGELANCYMVHPAPAGSGITRTYRIPIQRINDYWTGTADGYGASTVNGTTYSNNPLTVGEAWNASVLWSDMTAITTATPITASGTYTGVRSKDYFSFEVPAGTAAGNFVVQVKDAANTILWSWHLWVTDYEADQWRNSAVNSVPSASYAVFGGQVDSYNGTVWQSGGLLSGKVMMDRELGAIARGTTATETTRGQFYYPFGRKDPFPASLDGASTLQFTGDGTFPAPIAGPQTIAASVQAPTTFYTNSTGNWTSDATGTTYLWNDPNAPFPDTDVHQKSIYDPCPAGWRLPEIATSDSSASPWNKFSFSAFTTYAYAAAGSRSNDSSLNHVGTEQSHWSASPYSGTNGRYLYCYTTSLSSASNDYRANGYPVRCSQQ
ncbi:MAG: hypothetical protein LBL97_02980 [Prevotellaceae bacterium]|jgi:hypothetical protein|nr:hypothetical protein [Prevotellaceae bacterium]